MKFKSNIEIQAGVEDNNASVGTSGQVLSSTGTGVEWINQDAISSSSNFVYFSVKNETGATIPRGAGVMAVGTDGNSGHILIDEFIADGSVEPKYFLGLMEDSIGNGAFGRAVSFGEIDQINTNAFNDGDVLWTDPAVPGGLTTTEPDGPNTKLAVAIVLNSSTNGKVFCRVQGNEGVHDLHDTKIVNQVDGDVLVWDNTTGVWFNDSTLNVDYTNGRVGIGTTSPSQKLDVSGNISATGTITGSNLSGTNTGDQDLSGYLTITGKAADSNLLDGLDSTQFLRSDVDDTASGAYNFTNGNNQFNGHLYYNPWDANGNHYPHFRDGGNANGVNINWRLFSGSSYISHTWNYTDTNFVNSLRSTVDMRAPIFYDSDNTGYYLNPAGTSNILELNVNTVQRWYRPGFGAHQRADARLAGSDEARLHWYGKSNSDVTRNFKHAWYDGSNYIDVTANSGGRIDFTGAATSMYIGSDRVYDDGYHPYADSSNTATTASNSNALGGISSNRAILKRRTRIHTTDGTSLDSSITAPEMGFTYGGSGEPVGPFIAFGGLTGDINYSMQLVGAYNGGGNDFRVRTRNDDAATWNPWRTIWTNGNFNPSSYLLTTGKAADSNLLDGIDSSQFIRSDADDSFTGQLTMGTQKALVAGDYGRGVYGLYSASRLQHVWSMGTAYNLADNGTSPGNLYGLTWSHPNAGGVASNLTNHGLMLLLNGGWRASFGQSTSASSDMRAPIFYDLDNTGYYLNPASTSNLLGLTVNNTISGTTNGNVKQLNTSSGNIDDDWGTSFKTFDPIPTGTPPIQSPNIRTINVGENFGRRTQLAFDYASDRAWFRRRHNTTWHPWREFWHDGNDGSGSGLDADLLDGQHASAFAPVSHTHTWADISGETANSVNGWGGLRHQTNDGYIDFGPANSGHAHIYTDRPNFYLNKSIQVLGVSIMNQNDIRSKIFYDVDNTGYYVHPASISQLNTLFYDEWLRNNRSTASGLYWESVTPGNGWHIYPENRQDMTFRTGSGNGGIKGTIADATARGYIHWTTSNEIGFLNNSRSWSLRVDSAGNSFATASSRAPIFYDSNNTAYYVDPASTSNLNGITLDGSINFGSSNGNINLSRGGWITFYEDGNANHGIGSRNNTGSEADDIRINSYGAVYINLDSNNNNTSGADFAIGRHGSATGTISELFKVSGETGNVGIGTTSPGSQLGSTKVLDISGTGNSEIILDHTDAGASSDIGLYSWNRNNDHLAHIKASCDGSTTAAFISFHTQSSGGSFVNAASNERMRIKSNGNVGIGETSPSTLLQVKNPSNGTNHISYVIGGSGVSASNKGGFAVYEGVNKKVTLEYFRDGTGRTVLSSANDFIINTNNSQRLSILGSNGTATFASTVTATNFILSSDERKKTKIKDLPYNNINVNWKSFEFKEDEGEYRTGVIAQELEKSHPEFVNTDAEGFKSVKYIDLLIAKIAELENRIKELEK